MNEPQNALLVTSLSCEGFNPLLNSLPHYMSNKSSAQYKRSEQAEFSYAYQLCQVC
jgi:hypothetical protein